MATEVSGRVTLLKDKDGNVKLPRTVASAVTMEDGRSMQDAVNDILSDKDPAIFATKTELELKADKKDIPTKLSSLENDTNFISSIPSEYITEGELESVVSSKGFINNNDLETKLTEKNFLVHSDIAGKVDKVDGKELSSNDFTDEYKNKVDGLSDPYVHPETHPASMIVTDSDKQFVSESEKESWSNKLDMTTAEQTFVKKSESGTDADTIAELLNRINALEARVNELENIDVITIK